jgi:hypothetical protein
MTGGLTKGSEVKILWICGLLALLAVVAYGRFSIAPSNAGEPLPVTPASPSLSAHPRSPTLAHNDGVAAPNLSMYVYLHETRNASNVLQGAASTNACPE